MIDEIQTETTSINLESPGKQLEALRLQRGYSREAVAAKLKLRVRVIELLETDQYEKLPEPVFIRGYLRMYARLLNVADDTFTAGYNTLTVADRKVEKALWQKKKQPRQRERLIRWGGFVLVVCLVVTASFWWYKNKNEALLPLKQGSTVANPAIKTNQSISKNDDQNETDTVSKMQSLFTLNEGSLIHSQIRSESKDG